MKIQKLKLKIFFFTIIFGGLFGMAGKTWAATIDAISCNNTASNPDVQNAIDSASDGDTIIVPAGNCVWSRTMVCSNENNPYNSVCVTKNIQIIGAGIGNTIVTAGGSVGSVEFNYMLAYYPSNSASANLFRISGFTFNQNNQANGIGLGKSNYAWDPIPSNVRIDHNRFIVTNDPDWRCESIVNYNVFGVIDHNIFDHVAMVTRNTPGTLGPLFWGRLANNQGDANALFYENNLITGMALSDCVFEGTRVVWRYNDIIIPNVNEYVQLIDWHGAEYDSDSDCSCYGNEIYGNYIHDTRDGTRYGYGTELADMRGGKGMVYYNEFASDMLHPVIVKAFITSFGPVPPNYDACPLESHATLEKIQDTYVWKNREGPTGSVINALTGHAMDCAYAGASYPLEGRDYFDDNSSPGIGCGSLEDLPVSCSIGQGYWATSQSCSNLTGLVGSDPDFSISGTFYKCSSNDTWTTYYTPYAYPHPLRNESGDTTPPTSPTGLAVE